MGFLRKAAVGARVIHVLFCLRRSAGDRANVEISPANRRLTSDVQQGLM
jgi:hypothetical protein